MTLTTSAHRIATILRTAAPPAGIALGAAVLLRFPPTQYSFYPQCPIHEYFHLQCPGCGATRALAALLHGHIAEALHLNALVTLLLPFAAVYFILWYRRLLLQEPSQWPQLPSSAVYASLALAFVFTIARNLPN